MYKYEKCEFFKLFFHNELGQNSAFNYFFNLFSNCTLCIWDNFICIFQKNE